MPLNYEKLIGARFAPYTHRYTARDVVLYALGVGAGVAGSTSADELKYVYERSLVPLPMFAVLVAAPGMRLSDPELGVNYRKLVHSEQSLTMHKMLPAEGTVVGQAVLDDVYDRGRDKGVLVRMSASLRDSSSGDLLATVGSMMLLRGEGGFVDRRDAPEASPVPSDRPPDLLVPLPTSANQNLIYRLSGDHNPLHVDPVAAQAAGFPRPILHGLCTYGMLGRALIGALCGDDPQRFRGLRLRFTAPVYPGEPLQAQVWSVGASTVACRIVATERDSIVGDFGRFEHAPDGAPEGRARS